MQKKCDARAKLLVCLLNLLFFDVLVAVASLDLRSLVGSLSNDDGDVNKNGKKSKGFDWPNNNFARASRFFVHFFTVTARLQRENNFMFCRGREHKTTTSFFFPSDLLKND